MKADVSFKELLQELRGHKFTGETPGKKRKGGLKRKREIKPGGGCCRKGELSVAGKRSSLSREAIKEKKTGIRRGEEESSKR